MKIAELTGKSLDEWVAKALGYKGASWVPDELCGEWYAGETDGGIKDWRPSSDYAQCGELLLKYLPAIVRANPAVESWPAGGYLLVFICREVVRIECGKQFDD